MHLPGDAKEIGRALNDTPLTMQSEAVQEERERGKRFGYATAVVGRIKIDYA